MALGFCVQHLGMDSSPLAGARGPGLLGPPGPACLGLWAWVSAHTRWGFDALLERDRR